MSLRHERRRRLLAEDGQDTESPIRLAGARNDGAMPAYTDDARAARGRAVAGLVPLGRLAIGATVVLAVVLIAGCVALDFAAAAIAPTVGEEAALALRLDAPRSIGRWLASTLLGAAALTAVFIYSLRKHRSDDYQGRYRVWLWMAAAALVASLFESSGLAGLAKAGCHLAARAMTLRADIVWPATIATLTGGVGLRLFFEVRRSKSAIAGGVGAGVSFLVAAVTHHGWPVTLRADLAPLVSRGSWLLGYLLVMTTFLLYARFIELEITGGAVLSRKPKRKKVKPSDDASTESRPARKSLRLRTDLDPVDTSPAAEVAPAKVGSPSKLVTPTASASQGQAAPSSRAERRKMKQQTRMAG